jgi:hypothetical protein
MRMKNSDAEYCQKYSDSKTILKQKNLWKKNLLEVQSTEN